MLHCAGADVQPCPLSHAAAPIGHVAPFRQLFEPVQLTSHAHEVAQLIVPPHALEPSHATSHGPLPQVISPSHVLDEVHEIAHELAPRQLMPPPHAEGALHTTSQAIPRGQLITDGHALDVAHENAHVVAFVQRPPALVQASGQLVASGGTEPTTQ